MDTDDRLFQRWRATFELARAWDPPPKSTVIVSPHPDDETLSSGGLIARQRGRGISVIVVAVTDGEGAYPGDPADELAATRRNEQLRALRRLGVAAGDVYRLEVPDGGVGRHDSYISGADCFCLL